jgi:hypothetical protein
VVVAAAVALALVAVDEPELPQAASPRQVKRRRARAVPAFAARAGLRLVPVVRCMKLLYR